MVVLVEGLFLMSEVPLQRGAENGVHGRGAPRLIEWC